MTREDDRDLHTKEGTVKGEKIEDLKTRNQLYFQKIHMNGWY